MVNIQYMHVRVKARQNMVELSSSSTPSNFHRNYTLGQEKLDPFSFEHNTGKYCPILIIRSLLQTEINCDQVYPKSTTTPQICWCTTL